MEMQSEEMAWVKKNLPLYPSTSSFLSSALISLVQLTVQSLADTLTENGNKMGQNLSGQATASQANTTPCEGAKKSFLSSG